MYSLITRIVALPFAFALAASCSSTPQPLEVNLGPIYIDQYTSGTTGTMAACPAAYTVPQCIKYFFNNHSGDTPYSAQNYTAQGVTGVRFMFPVSPAWDANGNVLQTWVNNLNAFLADLKKYGITSVTPTPAWDGWGGGFSAPFFNASGLTSQCSGISHGKALYFWKWVPYGYIQNSQYSYSPECWQVSNSYSTAQSNPYFWGWTPSVSLVQQVISAVNTSGLTLREFDLWNELDLTDYAEEGRLIYDNTHSYDVLGAMRAAAGGRSGVVTFSVGAATPSSSAYDCASAYGDSALVIGLSELWAATTGQGFGVPTGSSPRNLLLCGGSRGQSYLPQSYTPPQIIDIHTYPSVIGSPGADVTLTAQVTYNAIYNFDVGHGTPQVMIGETYGNQYDSGMTPPMTPAEATQNANGYTGSLLYGQTCTGFTPAILRPWEDAFGSSFIMPNQIVPPYPAYLPSSLYCCQTACQNRYNSCVASCPPPGTPGNANQLCLQGCSTGYNGCMSTCH